MSAVEMPANDQSGLGEAKAQLESIRELVSALILAEENEDEEGREEAEQRILEDVLSVEVRTDWYTLDTNSDKKPAEYRILLSFGGPACQITGSLSEHGEVESARLVYQDWGTKWQELPVTPEAEEHLLRYASCFYFGE
jgi:hypothetical protein